jgi:predicted DNA-binding protein YlxM (UPF0122 family)
MDYIKTFDSFNFSIENLSKLNEAEVDSLFQSAFKSVLGGAKLTDKPAAEIKKDLESKLSSIKNNYKDALSNYIKDKYDAKWYSSILDIVAAPSSGFISVTGAKKEDTSSVKAREDAKSKFEQQPNGKSLVEESPLVAALIKNVVLVALPDGLELKEGMNTKNISPNTKSLTEMLYETSLDHATKLFESATSGLESLSDISFEFETVGDKIKKNDDNLKKYRGELKDLANSNDVKDWNKMIEMYCIINTLRAQQCALMAAQAEYEFLSGSFKKTFLGDVEGYAQALFEIAFFLLSSLVVSKAINALGQTSFIQTLKETVSSAAPTIIPGFQSAMNKIMTEVVNPASKNPLFMAAVLGAYTIIRGGQIAKELAFEQSEQYLLLALEQFIPTISAVNVSLATCDNSFTSISDVMNGKSWSPKNIWKEALDGNLDEKEAYTKRQLEKITSELYNLTLAEIRSENSPLIKAVNSMEVNTQIRSSLTPDIIFNSPIRGATGLYTFMDKLGLAGDWMKRIEDIFDTIEKPMIEKLEDLFISDDVYTKFINKENPTHAALGGLIFIAQSNVIIKNPTLFMKILDYKPEFPDIKFLRASFKASVEPLEIRPFPTLVDFSEPEVESCGVFVSIVDNKDNIYKSRIGMLYFEKGLATLASEKGITGIDGFSQLLQDYKFNFVVVGNADVSGPQEQKRQGGFIGNRLLSELRANTFVSSVKKSGDEKFSSLGCGKMYARNYPDYIKKDFSTSKIAELLGVSKTDDSFRKNMANDRRIEVIIFPENVDFQNFANNDPLIEKVCKKPFSETDDDKLIRMRGGKWFIDKSAESKYSLIFPKRGEKATNESNRTYVMSFDYFLNS